MKDKISLMGSTVVWGLLLLAFRLLAGQSEMNDFHFIFIIILLICGLILLVLSTIKIFKKNFKPLLILIFFTLTTLFFPFEFVTGWTQFYFNKADKLSTLSKLDNGEYNDLIQKEEYPESGIWIEDNNPRVKIFKDDSLRLLFFWQSHRWNGEQYCGTLYISNEKFLRDKKIYDFLMREFHYTKLQNNWYWVDCYVDYTPAP